MYARADAKRFWPFSYQLAALEVAHVIRALQNRGRQLPSSLRYAATYLVRQPPVVVHDRLLVDFHLRLEHPICVRISLKPRNSEK